MNAIGSKIIRLESVDSTNNYTANLINQGNICHGTVILADEQTKGKGQRSAIWHSRAGENITTSIFFTPDNLSVSNQFRLTQFISVAICELLESKNIHALIKWPNDIYVGNRKIAGILIENQLAGDRVKSSIVGIGLNVNQIDFGDIQATSIKNETKGSSILMEVLYGLIGVLNEAMNTLWNDEKKLSAMYLNRLLGYQKEQLFRSGGNEFNGIIQGTTQRGALMVKIEKEIKEFEIREIEFILQSDF